MPDEDARPHKNLIDHLEANDTLAEFSDGFPRVSQEQVQAVLESSYISLVGEFDHREAA